MQNSENSAELQRIAVEDDLERRRITTTHCDYPGCVVANGLFRCTKCKKRFYCGREHQAAAWRSHKRFCREPSFDDINPPGYDMVNPLGHKGRAAMALDLVDGLVQSFERDLYPAAEVEGVFGIEMGSGIDERPGMADYPIGKLVYNAWVFVWKAFVEFEMKEDAEAEDESFTEIRARQRRAVDVAKLEFIRQCAQALLAGNLSAWFQERVETYRPRWGRRFRPDVYVEELHRRHFEGIPWNRRIQRMYRTYLDERDPRTLNSDPVFWIYQSDPVRSGGQDGDTGRGGITWESQATVERCRQKWARGV